MQMRKFGVMIGGENFLVRFDGDEPRKFGFVTWRFVEAANESDAESIAVASLREDQSLQTIVLNTRDDSPVLNVEEINELVSFDGIENLSPGLIWYDPEKE